MLSPKEIAYSVTKALDEKKGMNIKLLKIDRVSSLADYFLICTGTSNTHVRTLCDYAEYVLEELGDSIQLGRIDLSAVEKSQKISLPITLPEGITNLSNITQADVDIQFSGLMVKSFEVENIEAVNVPEELEAEIIEKKLTIILRGPAADLMKITEADIVIRADLTGAVVGTSTFKATVHFGEEFSMIGAVRSYSVTANVVEK